MERRQGGLLEQCALTLVGERDAFQLSHPFDDLPRRHWLRRIAQHVVDQPQAFARPEPGIAHPALARTDLLRPDLRVEQPMLASRCVKAARCSTTCCSRLVTWPANSDRLLRNAPMTCGSLTATLLPNLDGTRVDGQRCHPNKPVVALAT